MNAEISSVPRDNGRAKRIPDGEPAITWVSAIWRAFAAGCGLLTLALTMGCIMAAAASAAEDAKPEEIAGRWTSEMWGGKCIEEACKGTFDIVPCGNGWCAIEVANDGKCGRVAIRLETAKMEKMQLQGMQFTGKFSAAEGTEPFTLGATLYRVEGKLRLNIYGHTGGQFTAFRRSYPLEITMSRAGDATCKTDEKTS